MGLSYEKFAMTYAYFHTSNYNLITLFRLLGQGVLRVGGGSVDKVLWTSSRSGTHLQITASNVQDLAGFLKATGWLCLYGVNLATSTPALAAEEVACVVSALGSNLLGIELGNEPDEYGVAGSFFAGNWTFQNFLNRWNSFRSVILQAVPHVPMTGPATGGGNHISTWTLPFAKAALLSRQRGQPHLYRHLLNQSRPATYRRPIPVELGSPAAEPSVPHQRVQLLLQRRRRLSERQLRVFPVGHRLSL
jgi:hypothetical protein